MTSETGDHPLPPTWPVRWWKWIASGFAILFITCTGLWPLVGILAFGWIFFLKDHVAQFPIDKEAVCWVTLGLAVLLVGMHALCHWLWRSAAGEDASQAVWPFSATMKIFVGMLALTVAGISIVSVAHQVTWLMRDPDGLSVNKNSFHPRYAEIRAMSKYNLKQLGLGATSYGITKDRLPQSRFSSTGRPLHNWITVLLPELGRADLADLVDLRRPWDDPVNSDVFASHLEFLLRPGFEERIDAQGLSVTHYAANSRLISGQRETSLTNIPDGAANTILFGESYDQFPAWGRPLKDRDPALGLNVPGGFGSKSAPEWGVLFTMADGAVRSISPSVDPEVMRQLATPDGGETISPDKLKTFP